MKQKDFLLFLNFFSTLHLGICINLKKFKIWATRPGPNLQLHRGLGIYELWRRKLYPTILSSFSRHKQCEKSNRSFKQSSFVMLWVQLLRHNSFPRPKFSARPFSTLRASFTACIIWQLKLNIFSGSIYGCMHGLYIEVLLFTKIFFIKEILHVDVISITYFN